jgi:hypothetical protein
VAFRVLRSANQDLSGQVRACRCAPGCPLVRFKSSFPILRAGFIDWSASFSWGLYVEAFVYAWASVTSSPRASPAMIIPLLLASECPSRASLDMNLGWQVGPHCQSVYLWGCGRMCLVRRTRRAIRVCVSGRYPRRVQGGAPCLQPTVQDHDVHPRPISCRPVRWWGVSGPRREKLAAGARCNHVLPRSLRASSSGFLSLLSYSVYSCRRFAYILGLLFGESFYEEYMYGRDVVRCGQVVLFGV